MFLAEYTEIWASFIRREQKAFQLVARIGCMHPASLWSFDRLQMLHRSYHDARLRSLFEYSAEAKMKNGLGWA